MRFQKSRSFISVGLCGIACLIILTACHKMHFVKRHTSDPVKQVRMDWNLKTTVDAYQKAGFASRKWDDPAIRALAEFAYSRANTLEPDERWSEIISSNAAAAVRAGCKDPMVNYIFIKFAMDQTNSRETYIEAFCAMARAMKNSSYPPIRKFYAAARTLDQIFYTYGTNSSSQPDTYENGAMLTDNLNATLADKTTPAREAYEAADTALSLVHGKANLDQFYRNVEKHLFENWPDDYTSWLFKGSVYIKMAWAARGGGYADKVTEEGWKSFGEDLAVADSALEKAWQLNSDDEHIPIEMIRVAEGRQKKRAEMELWFNRAMTINSNCYEACKYKLHYLYPQWYGSREIMVAFGRQCAASTNWGGNVPLILSDAHREYWLYLNDSEEKSNYWKLPEVWPDIKAAFDRFFELNPDAIGYYHNYAWYAYKCEQWDKLNELIPKLGPVNYAYFGGEDEFDKMVQLAKEHASNPK